MTGLRPIDDGLWVAEGDNFVGFGAWFPVRMTVVRVGEGLWINSPIPVDDALKAQIDALGEVRWIVNPCGFHGAWAGDAVARWPDAEFLCASSPMLKKAKLPASRALEGEPPAAWGDELDALLVQGAPKVSETVFLHRSSRTLITTDLLFNIHESKAFLMPWILRLVGAWKRPYQSRLWRTVTSDRAAAGASIERILQWDFDRVIMAHGDIVEAGGKDVLAAATEWMRGGVKALPAG